MSSCPSIPILSATEIGLARVWRSNLNGGSLTLVYLATRASTVSATILRQGVSVFRYGTASLQSRKANSWAPRVTSAAWSRASPRVTPLDLSSSSDDSIQLIASGSSNFGPNADWIGWNRAVLEKLRGEIHYISLHTYIGNRENNFERFLAASQDIDNRIEVVEG